jgi:hypothetical protein
VRPRRIQRKKNVDWTGEEEKGEIYVPITSRSLIFFIFNLNGLLKGIYGISRLKKSKTN